MACHASDPSTRTPCTAHPILSRAVNLFLCAVEKIIRRVDLSETIRERPSSSGKRREWSARLWIGSGAGGSSSVVMILP
jgi:hypothetical protein